MTDQKKTRATVNKALSAQLGVIEGYIVPYDEAAHRARLSSPSLGLPAEVIEAAVASKRKLAASKVTAADRETLAAEVFGIVKGFYAEEAKTRERITLPSILEPLMASGADANAVLFAVESFVADAAKRQAEAASKVAAK
jgi:hypothetical protein